jgi:8-oxo-dGTP pyrophosphatase MutT (NUDIX family)
VTLAAGILFLTPEGNALYLKRGAGGDFPGYWAFPGGHLEGEESLEDCARREATEELGAYPKTGSLREWTRAIAPPLPYPDSLAGEPVDFTTFVAKVDAEFAPKLNGEHVGYAWAPVGEPPSPLHPGCQVALDRIDMDELGVARAIADGRLTSPQVYENVTLFAIRITGTGAAYRHALNEYVWRDPEHYINDEFLARCNGLPVIFEHPKGALLNSKEFSDRMVGTVLLPFVRGDEVWGVAKVYDAPAIKLMVERQLSTSPAVSWRDLSVNAVFKQEDGSRLLIEGKPSILDHIAICDRGVWDKDGAPSGVQNDNLTPADASANAGTLTVERTDSNMTPEEQAAADKARKDAEDKEKKEREDRAKADADAGQKLDTLLTHMDNFGKRLDTIEAKADAACGRMDAFEKKGEETEDEKKAKADKARKDAESETEEEKKAKADKARKDADEKKEREDKARKDAEEKERADAARTDAATISEIQGEVANLKKSMPRQLTDADHADLTRTQARFDSVYQAFGRHAPRAMQSETLQEYRLRLCNELKEHSPTWKLSNLAVVAVDSASFDVVETSLLAEARRAAMEPTDLTNGEIREVVRIDSTTHRPVHEFYAAPGRSFVHDFSSAPQYLTRLNTPNAANRAA